MKLIKLSQLNKLMIIGVVGAAVVISGTVVGVKKHNETVRNNELAASKAAQEKKEDLISNNTKSDEKKEEDTAANQSVQSADQGKQNSTVTVENKPTDASKNDKPVDSNTNQGSTTNSSNASTSNSKPNQANNSSPKPAAPAPKQNNNAAKPAGNITVSQQNNAVASNQQPQASQQPTYPAYTGFSYDWQRDGAQTIYVGGENPYTKYYPDLPNKSTVKFDDLNSVAQQISMGAIPEKVKQKLVGKVYKGKYLITDFYVDNKYVGRNEGPNHEIWGAEDVYNSFKPEITNGPEGLFAGAVCDFQYANEQGIIRLAKLIIKFKEI
jgi:hypothetical protein